MVAKAEPPRSLITVGRVGNAIRVSRVTAHGDEVIEPDIEARALAILLWGLLNQGEVSSVGTPLLPWDHISEKLDRLTAAVDTLTAEMKNTQHMLAVHRVALDAAQKPTPVRVRGQ